MKPSLYDHFTQCTSRSILFIAGCLFALSASDSCLAQCVQGIPLSFADIAESIQPSVVNISSSKTVSTVITRAEDEQTESPFYEKNSANCFQYRHLGSGLLIDAEGYIITNHHVIESADEIRVKLTDSRTFQADIIGHDIKTDIALIKIHSDQRDFPLAVLGDSDAIRVGEWVIAVGNPYGLSHTVTAGIISAKSRVIDGPYDDFIQTDASINPGNSGGPLINIQGQVIGINTAVFSNAPGNGFAQGIGFAIPINLVRRVISDLRHYGKVKRGWIGVVIQEVTEELAASFNLPDTRGAMVTDIIPDGPADIAGLFHGDVILQFNESGIQHSIDLPRIAADNPPGTECVLRVNRDGEELAVTIVLGEFPDSREALTPSEEN
ncbi:peptidase [candidate division KSB3 bacterium]|nr:MAG: peptidase [candidate division KSB3 bacterium]